MDERGASEHTRRFLEFRRPELSPEQIEGIVRNPERLIEHIDAINEAKRRHYRSFLDSMPQLSAKVRADSWLAYWAANSEDFGHEEAAIYLASRAEDVAAATDRILTHWRRAERYELEFAASQDVVFFLNGSHSRQQLSAAGVAARIAELDPAYLRTFWHEGYHGDWAGDATVWRAVEWLELGGFDAWLRRASALELESALEGRFEAIPLAYSVFAISRSPLAIDSGRRAWERNLEMLAFGGRGREPWLRLSWHGDRPVDREHLEYASCLAFALARVSGAAHKDTVERVAELLVARQSDDGGWSMWAGMGDSTILSTALALHALSTSETRGAARAVRKGARFLWGRQSNAGPWEQPHTGVDSIFLTVLVLDAIALAEGGPTTLTPPRGGQTTAAMPLPLSTGSPRRFRVGFSFPGEQRDRVRGIADRVAAVLGKEKVLYDQYIPAELAVLNLDVHLQHLYQNETDTVVVVVCEDYERKDWCRLEWRAIRNLINRRRPQDIILLRADDAEVPGIFAHDGYIDMRQFDDEEIAAMILQRSRAG